MQLMSLENAPGAYCDAYVVGDHGQLVFLSVWGRDTSMQKFLAQLTLTPSEGGLSLLELTPTDSSDPDCVSIDVAHRDRLVKTTARMPATNLLGAFVQAWVYDPLVRAPDRGRRRALMLYRPAQDADAAIRCSHGERLWALFKTLSHLPVLDDWRQALLEEARPRQWLKTYGGLRVAADVLDLSDSAYEDTVREWIRSGRLAVPDSV